MSTYLQVCLAYYLFVISETVNVNTAELFSEPKMIGVDTVEFLGSIMRSQSTPISVLKDPMQAFKNTMTMKSKLLLFSASFVS